MKRAWDRFEAKVDPDNGMFVGCDDCHYETEKEAIVDATICLCGCGRPEEVQGFLINALRCIESAHLDTRLTFQDIALMAAVLERGKL